MPNPVPAQGVPVFNPDGELVSIPRLDQAALMHGYRPATPEDIQEAQAEAQYGGVGQGLASAAEGAASALTFGIAPRLEVATGLTTPEAIRGRQEAHPIAHGLGTAAGIIAPLALTAGAAAPAEAAGMGALRAAAEHTAPALIAKAGRAVAGATEGALPGAVGRVLPAVAAGATEGALYSGSDVTEKALLGDPGLTWEKAASELGLGALFGGALGGFTDAGAKGLGHILEKATEGLHSIAQHVAEGDPAVVKLMLKAEHQIADLGKVVPDAAEHLAGSSPETVQFIVKNIDKIKELEKGFPGLTEVLSRGDPDTGAEILKNWGKLLKDPQRRIEVGSALLDSTQSTYSTIESALGKFNREIRPEEAEALLSGPHTVELPGGGSALEYITPEAAQGEGSRVLGRLGQAIDQMRHEPDLFDPGYVRQLELFRDGLTQSLTENPTPEGIFQRLRLLRQQLDGEIPWNAETRALSERKAISEFKNLRAFVRDSITNPEAWGQAGVRQGALDKAYSEYFGARKQLLAKLGEGQGTAKTISPTKVNAWVNAMADMRGKVKTDAFTDFAEAAKKLATEMETSGLQGAPEIRKAIEEATARAEDIRQRAAITQLVKMLQGREILSSGPAVPMVPRIALEAAKRIPGGVGHIVGGITGTISKVRDPSVMVGVLSALDKFAKKASSRLQSGADAIFRSGTGGAVAGSASEKFAHGGMVTPEKFHDVSTSLRGYGGDLDRLATQVSKETRHLQDHAPGTADAAHAFAARVVQHLGKKLPQDAGPRQLLDPPFEPSRTELAEYNRHHEIASRGPVAVLEHLKAGTLHPSHLEASQAIWPKLHAEAHQLVAEKMAEHLAKKEKIPSALRSGLGLFLGADLEHATTGQAILSAQLAYAGEPSAPNLANAPTVGQGGKTRNVETRFSERASTGSQGTETRMGTRV